VSIFVSQTKTPLSLKGCCSPAASAALCLLLAPVEVTVSPPTAGLAGGGCSHTGVSTEVVAAACALTGTRVGRQRLLPGRMQQNQPLASLHYQDLSSSRAQQPIPEHEDTSDSAAGTPWEQSVSSQHPQSGFSWDNQGYKSQLRSNIRVRVVPMGLPSLSLLLCYADTKVSLK